MNKTSLIARHEFLTTLRRRSYGLSTIGVPLLLLALLTGLARTGGSNGQAGTVSMDSRATLSSVEGYVDQSGLIQTIPRVVLRSHLLPFAGEEQARRAMATGRISAYYRIPADYVERGELYYVYPDSRPLTADGQEWKIVSTLFVNLIGDEELAERVWDPVDLEVFDFGAASSAGRPSALWTRFFPSLLVILFFASFMLSSSLLSESVATEKANRTIEVLMLSASPAQIFAGKVIGLGIAMLLQTVTWLMSVFLALQLGGGRLGLPAESPFPPSLVAWGVVLFLFGFSTHAVLMAGAGALVARLKEVSHVAPLVLSPLMAGYTVALLAPLADATQKALPVALSLFPLTSPVVMMMRLAAGPVPGWHLALALVLMALCACLTLRAVAGLFRAQTLLSGQPLSPARLFRLLLNRAC